MYSVTDYSFSNGVPASLFFEDNKDDFLSDTFLEVTPSAVSNTDEFSQIYSMTQESLSSLMEEEAVVEFVDPFFKNQSGPPLEPVNGQLTHQHQWTQLPSTENFGEQTITGLEEPMPYCVEESNQQLLQPVSTAASTSTTSEREVIVTKIVELNQTADKCKVCGEKSLNKIDTIALCPVHIDKWESYTKEELAGKVKKARLAANYAQSITEELLHKNKHWLRDRENGKVWLHLSDIQEIAEALNIPLAEFFEDVQVPNNNECEVCEEKSHDDIDGVGLCATHISVWKNFNSKDLGKKLCVARLEAHYTQKTLAEKLRKSKDWLGFRENGKSCVTLSELKKLANQLNVPLSYFFKEEKKISLTEKESIKCAVCAKKAFEEFDSVQMCHTHLSQWNNIDQKNLGLKIKKARLQLPREQSLQKNIAAQLGWGRRWVSDREVGRFSTKLSELVQLAGILKVNLAFFFDE